MSSDSEEVDSKTGESNNPISSGQNHLQYGFAVGMFSIPLSIIVILFTDKFSVGVSLLVIGLVSGVLGAISYAKSKAAETLGASLEE